MNVPPSVDPSSTKSRPSASSVPVTAESSGTSTAGPAPSAPRSAAKRPARRRGGPRHGPAPGGGGGEGLGRGGEAGGPGVQSGLGCPPEAVHAGEDGGQPQPIQSRIEQIE